MVHPAGGMTGHPKPVLLILNQMAGPLTWEFAEDFAKSFGTVALLTGHPDTLAKGNQGDLFVYSATAYHRGSYSKRVVSWIRYWIQAFVWVWKWPGDVPLLLFSNPPTLCWLGRLLCLMRGQRYALMVHDIYPDLLVKLGKGTEKNLLIRCWRLLNRFSYEKAEVVMTLGKHMASTLAKSFDPERTSHGRIETFYPWADTELLKPLPKADNWFAKQHDQLNKLTVMYSGNMGIGHDIETMLEVAVELKDKPNIHFMFIGDGPKWQLVHTFVREKRLSNITVLGWQAEKVVPFSLATADIAFVSLEEGLAGLAIPSKSFSFLAVGVPLLVISSENTELSDIISQYKCGWILRPKDAKTMRSLCETLDEGDDLQRIKAQSREAAQAIGSRRNSVEMGALLASILIRPIVSFVAKTGIK